MLLKWIKWSGTSAKKSCVFAVHTRVQTVCNISISCLRLPRKAADTNIIQGDAGDKGTQCALTDYAAQRGLEGVEGEGWREAAARPHPLFMKF